VCVWVWGGGGVFKLSSHAWSNDPTQISRAPSESSALGCVSLTGSQSGEAYTVSEVLLHPGSSTAMLFVLCVQRQPTSVINMSHCEEEVGGGREPGPIHQPPFVKHKSVSSGRIQLATPPAPNPRRPAFEL